MRHRLKQDTRYYVDSLHGNNSNNGLIRECAFKTLQGAWDWVYSEIDAHLHSVEFFLVNSGAPYSGVIAAYQIPGLPHDYGVRFTGELDAAGHVCTLVEDSSAGCFHIAGGCQVYIRNVAVRSHNGAQSIKAAYHGSVFLDNMVFYGADGAALIEAGPVYSRVEINSPFWVHNLGTAGSAILSAYDTGSITVPAQATCTIQGNPYFSFSTVAVSDRGKMQVRCPFVGDARGRRWTTQSDGMILTGRDLDSYIPGDAPGSSLDGTGLRL